MSNIDKGRVASAFDSREKAAREFLITPKMLEAQFRENLDWAFCEGMMDKHMADVTDLFKQHGEGLITTVEFFNKLIDTVHNSTVLTDLGTAQRLLNMEDCRCHTSFSKGELENGARCEACIVRIDMARQK